MHMQPTDWGWKLEHILTSVESCVPIAPDMLLNVISCDCKADSCGISCGCRKIGVYCSEVCKKCNGQTCNNTAPVPKWNDLEQLIDDITSAEA